VLGVGAESERMKQKTHVPIEDMDFFQTYVRVNDWVWSVVSEWSPLEVNP
jgi:hypothetical protein